MSVVVILILSTCDLARSPWCQELSWNISWWCVLMLSAWFVQVSHACFYNKLPLNEQKPRKSQRTFHTSLSREIYGVSFVSMLYKPRSLSEYADTAINTRHNWSACGKQVEIILVTTWYIVNMFVLVQVNVYDWPLCLIRCCDTRFLKNWPQYGMVFAPKCTSLTNM